MYDRGIDERTRHCVVGYQVRHIQFPKKSERNVLIFER